MTDYVPTWYFYRRFDRFVHAVIIVGYFITHGTHKLDMINDADMYKHLTPSIRVAPYCVIQDLRFLY